jgi:glycosyltransferase involved in cell wall biosynthesis
VNVVFASYHSFVSNSAIHIFHLANGLARGGVDCTVAVPVDPDTVREVGKPEFRVCTFEEALRTPPRAQEGPTLIHAWTPRENVRRFTLELAARLACRYVVHLEDNEESILERVLGTRVEDLLRRPEADVVVPDQLSHPHRYRTFLAGAAGVTAIIDRLLEFAPANVPQQVFWPSFDPELDWSPPRDERLRKQLGIAADEHVVAYTGNVHLANRREVASLYLAVALLRRRGVRLRLVRTGTDHASPFIPELAGLMKSLVIELGRRSRDELPSILALADVLVQPGGPDPFNDFRFPSKLPEFLASGKPVILPRSNIGRHLEDGRECVLLDVGNAIEIARKLEALLADESRRARIGAAGRAYALANLSWPKAVAEVRTFYERLLGSRPRSFPRATSPERQRRRNAVWQGHRHGSGTARSDRSPGGTRAFRPERSRTPPCGTTATASTTSGLSPSRTATSRTSSGPGC